MYDNEFLKQLEKSQHKVTYAKIVSLDKNDKPIGNLSGIITSGSISVDGTSSVRRTCSLSFNTNEITIDDYLWALKTRIKLFIGVENKINSNYPDIIWFNQGVYVITQFSTSQSQSGLSISLSAKDKMCLLNGEISGQLESQVDFGKVIIQNPDGTYVTQEYKIVDIIKEAVHTYGKENWQNIIINDVPEMGLNLLKYNGSSGTDLFLLKSKDSQNSYQSTILTNSEFHVYNQDKKTSITLANLCRGSKEDKICYIKISGKNTPFEYAASQYQSQENVGYETTDLVFVGDLIGNVGETLTSILDKIKNMLGDYEYFYDLDGRFVFQQKKTSVTTVWNPIKSSGIEKYVTSSVQDETISYYFDMDQIISINNSPDINNIKNDFSCWGTRSSTTGVELPIHMRYAIDEKPEVYVTLGIADDNSDLERYNKANGTNIKGQESRVYIASDTCDWRELIYQMSLDYLKYGHVDNFERKLIDSSATINNATYSNADYYPTGKTGYEQYYIDINGFWRQIYDYEYEEADIYALKGLFTKHQANKAYLSADITYYKYVEKNNNYVVCSESEKTDSTTTLYYFDIIRDDNIRNNVTNHTITNCCSYNRNGNFFESTICYVLKEYPSASSTRTYYKLENNIYSKVDKPDTSQEYCYFAENNATPSDAYAIRKEGNIEQFEPSSNELQTYTLQKDNILYTKDSLTGVYSAYTTRTDFEYFNPVGTLGLYYSRKQDSTIGFIANPETSPETLNFWFDFLDTNCDLGKFSVKAIGQRPKSENNSNVKVIHYRDVPNVIFYTSPNQDKSMTGYEYIKISSKFADTAFSKSSKGVSAKETIDSWISSYCYFKDQISLSTVPIYTLEPNTKIFVQDNQSNVDGIYYLTRYSIPLGYNGTMSITASKATTNII